MIRFDLSEVPRISIEEAKNKFDDRSAVFVDTRSRADYEKAHIPGAISMPLRELPTRLGELPREKEIVTY